MNPTLKFIICFLFKFPLYYVVVNGLSLLTGWNIWWCVPIAFVLDMMYYFGENIRKVDE